MDGQLLGGGRFRVVRKLGSGGMATVYLAEDERLGRTVALKRMHSELAPGLAERFQREARLGASLNHPNVVRVFDVVEDEDDTLTTLVLEYVDGENLAQAIRRGPLSPERAMAVLEPLAEALDHAHANGVVHRDVKPANVLIARDGAVKLSDLGVATGVDVTRVTSSGAAVGSAPYMAPEQLAGGEVTAAADIYALATVAFEALSGRRARTGDSPMAIVHQVANAPPPDLTEAWPEAPARASAVLRRGMADQPEDRPQSAAGLVSDLGVALKPGPASATAAPPADTARAAGRHTRAAGRHTRAAGEAAFAAGRAAFATPPPLRGGRRRPRRLCSRRSDRARRPAERRRGRLRSRDPEALRVDRRAVPRGCRA